MNRVSELDAAVLEENSAIVPPGCVLKLCARAGI